ncbi:hypothetical protein LZA78_02655 [Sinirhodobacter sp. WL0062]|uniref:Uncharacterized protein n=1 Tax=Rhodobacter flavimaris TaxID=2907145 RepID=A0ABS8YR83_9RHOB|nr:hypothetical protein [Sinirhodobacter sp. WL0062]MCE5972391.1 hypothetical protein [Sinirhodobacter sp. WL0062]
MSRLSIVFLGTASAAAVALNLIQVQVGAAGPAAEEPIARSAHEFAPSGTIHGGH